MTDRVLTDAEIDTISDRASKYQEALGSFRSSWRQVTKFFAREVEAAVLAKVRENRQYLVREGQVMWNGRSMVSEHECREREREAYLSGWRHDGFRMGPRFYPFNKMEARDPSLLPKQPPPLKLSTGTWALEKTVNVTPRYWQKDGFTAMYDAPECRTPEDHDKTAAWLRQYGESP